MAAGTCADDQHNARRQPEQDDHEGEQAARHASTVLLRTPINNHATPEALPNKHSQVLTLTAW